MSTISGRARARSNPLWATTITRMLPGPRTVVQGLHGLIQRSPQLAALLWIGSGWRVGSSEHQSGTAVDIIITADTGMTPTSAERQAALVLLEWVIDHATAIGLVGIIFSRDGRRRPEVWGYSQPGKWRQLPPRGSISADHVDHIHLRFLPSAAWPVALIGATVGAAASAPKPVPPARPALRSYPIQRRTVSLAVLQEQAKAAGKARVWRESVETIQECLRRDGYPIGPVDGLYGAKTRDCYAAYQRACGFRGDDADGVPGRASLQRLAATHGFRTG